MRFFYRSRDRPRAFSFSSIRVCTKIHNSIFNFERTVNTAMKNLKKIMAMCLAVIMMLSCIPAVYAADVANATIDPDAKGSLTLFKYDLTNAEKDGVWDSSYVSTGVYDENVNKTLGVPAEADVSHLRSVFSELSDQQDQYQKGQVQYLCFRQLQYRI